MIRLSDRLMMIAQQIKQNETMADIGTDHGFLPMYLADEGISAKVILADISSGSLGKAEKNLTDFLDNRKQSGISFPEDVFEFRLGSGIEVLECGEVDAVVIAGMGGMLISEIIEKDINKSKSIGRFILQPRNGEGKLRYRLIKQGFRIEKDLLVREGRFICQIITAVPDKNAVNSDIGPYDDIKYRFPASLLDNGDLGREYINKRLVKEKIVIKNIKDNAARHDEPRKKEIQRRIDYLEGLLERK